MAQTKQKAKPKKANSKQKAKPSKASPKAVRKAPQKMRVKAHSSGAAIEGGAKDAANAIGRAASKAKGPLAVSGAALAGAAGGAALASRRRRHRGINGHGLARTAKRVGDFGAQMGAVAVEMQHARDASNGQARRSPIEVVLEGLTARGRSSD